MKDDFDRLGFSPEETTKEPYVPNLESGLRGLAQGGTMGFADELTGGAEAGMDALSSMDLSNLVQNYQKYRDQTRDLYKQAQEADPAAYGAGEIGGAIASSIIPIGKAVGVGGKIAQSAALGGLASTGTSEASSPEELALDAAKGAALGGGIPVALSGLVKGTKVAGKAAGSAISKLLDKFELTKKIKLATKMGEEGVDLASKQPALDAAEAISGIPKFIKEETLPIRAGKLARLQKQTDKGELYDFVETIKKGMGQVDEALKAGSIDEATAERLKKTIQDEAYEIAPNLIKGGSKVTEKTTEALNREAPIKRTIKEMTKGAGEKVNERVDESQTIQKFMGETPTELSQSQTTIADLLQPGIEKQQATPLQYQDLIDKIYNLEQRAVGEGKNVFKGIGRELKEGIKDPEVKKANKLIHDALSASEEAINITKGSPSAETVGTLRDLIPGTGDITRSKKLLNLTDSMKALNEPKATGLLSDITEKLQRQEVAEEAAQRGIGSVQQALGSVRAITLNTANLAGKGAKWYADKATRYQGTKLGSTLEALSKTEGPRRAALIYSAMQIPEQREELHKILNEE